MSSTLHNPPHPGITLRDDVLPALGLSVTESRKAAWRIAGSAVAHSQWPCGHLAGNGLADRSLAWG
jgi:antitoxin HigA-1